jgi:hypothetical protein
MKSLLAALERNGETVNPIAAPQKVDDLEDLFNVLEDDDQFLMAT